MWYARLGLIGMNPRQPTRQIHLYEHVDVRFNVDARNKTGSAPPSELSRGVSCNEPASVQIEEDSPARKVARHVAGELHASGCSAILHEVHQGATHIEALVTWPAERANRVCPLPQLNDASTCPTKCGLDKWTPC